MADTQRHRILCALIAEPLTAAELADRLAIPRTRVYYHLDLLQRHGFITIVDMRNAAISERVYRAVASSFRVDRRLLGAEVQSLNVARSELLEATADDVRRIPGNDDELLVQRTFVRMSSQRRKQLRAALVSLVTDYSESEPDGTEVEIAIAIFDYPENKA
jgi:DNA-binding transcriptional ArsR family regulator